MDAFAFRHSLSLSAHFKWRRYEVQWGMEKSLALECKWSSGTEPVHAPRTALLRGAGDGGAPLLEGDLEKHGERVSHYIVRSRYFLTLFFDSMYTV